MLDNMKAIALPNITEWTGPQDHIRFAKNVKELELFEWLFCHPSAFKLVWWRGVSFLLLMNTAFSVFISVKYGSWLALIPGVIFGYLAIDQYRKKGKIVKLDPNYTFYDLYLREKE